VKILVYGAGVLGSLHAARLFEAGLDVSLLARGQRLGALRKGGVLLAEGDTGVVRTVAVPLVETPVGDYDLTLVFVRTHQIDEVLESLAGQSGDVLFLLNWAAGAEPLGAVIGLDRVLLGFPAQGGVFDGDVVRFRASTPLTRLVPMPIGEPNGSESPRVKRIARVFRSAGFSLTIEPRMDAWLKTHAAFEVPLGQAVHAAGGPDALSADPRAIRAMIRAMRRNLASLPGGPVPRSFNALRTIPEGVLVPVFRGFLRSGVAEPLKTDTPAVHGELERLQQQLSAMASPGSESLSR
jgi:2-dehydropantoate 2-reductase